MTTYPNCKINLGLHVVGRRADGYHDLETLFLPVPDLCDELEITEQPAAAASSSGAAPQPRMSQSGIALDNAPEDNLCIRAWRLLHNEFAIPAVDIRLEKHIPFGAGLGGGSSDAAFTLRMLNDMFSLGLGTADLERRAARLGADCAFFIQNRPAYATGIGDQLEPIEWKAESGKWKVVIEIPDGEHVSTKEAYAGLKLPGCSPSQGELSAGLRGKQRPDLRQAIRRPIEEWRTLIVNDFEASVFPAHPAIAALKDDFYRRGALYASMTGSGAAVFGIFAR
ncbi:MAG: 4-(cytidine 5'-diphospho)-2-C-methyl-D-erythritol kinase [Bacteroidales bacterium]|nr:4-(cytidine 5'-diphospho)-2-C-methyl-D-erythritol kinase [Bacteroidales bacterium]